METVVVAFEGEKNGRRLKELLESSGTAACLLCRTADQVKRLVRQQRLTAVVCGYKLPDGTAEELAGELPGFCTVLLLAPRGLLELVPERPGLLRLSAPAGRRELLAAVEELLRLGEEAGALLPPRRSREEREVVERAKADGYVSTLMGRRRWLPELKSSNFNLRSFGERVALNMPIQGTGHADLVQTQNGDWYAVFLAFRTSQQYFHHLGRETCLAPVVWEDGFPYIGTCPLSGEVNLPPCPVKAPEAVTDFRTQGLEWVMLREPNPDLYAFTEGGLVLQGVAENLSGLNPTLLMRRQQHFAMRAEAEVEFSPRLHEEAGLTTFYNLETHYEIFVTRTQAGRRVQVRRVVGDMEMLAADVPAPAGELTLAVEATALEYTFLLNGEALCTAQTRFVSTEATPSSFTGVMLGLYATGNGRKCAGKARFARFRYEGRDE